MVQPSPFETPVANLDRPIDAGTPGVNGRAEMAYMEAFKSFFELESWGKNLGFLTLCVLIPIAGMLAMLGYFISLTTKQHYNGEHDLFGFTFDRFGDYIGRGIWPFLCMLIVTFAMMPIFGIFVAGAVMAANTGIGGAAAGILALVGGVLMFVLMIAMTFVIQPIMLRAAYMQSVSGVFDLEFVRDFVSKMWLEIILASLFNFAVSLVGIFVGYLACGLGVYPAMTVMNWTQWQLHRQLYEVFIYRGGRPIVFNQALIDNP